MEHGVKRASRNIQCTDGNLHFYLERLDTDCNITKDKMSQHLQEGVLYAHSFN